MGSGNFYDESLKEDLEAFVMVAKVNTIVE
jgi:hypothetical protein